MASEKTPRVSVVIPTHNRAQLLLRALKSVQRQTFSDWECVVVDDSSLDETPEVLAQISKEDSRFLPIRIDRGHAEFPGIYMPLNEGLKFSRGEYIARLDDDDEWICPEKLKMQVEYLEKNPDYAVVGGGMIVRDENGKEKFRYFKPENDSEIRAGALSVNPIQHPTVLIRASSLKEVGGYPTQRYAEDWELWLRLGEKWKLHNIREYFTAYEQSQRSWSYIVARPLSKSILGIITRHRKNYPGYLRGLLLNLSQFLYGFLPGFIRAPLHSTFSAVKRGMFSGG
jgi:glycosyltransferase involved in cell wall biosynthesis